MTAGWPAVVAAFVDTGAAIAALLRSAQVGERWSEPSVLRGYTVGALVAHLVQATERVGVVLQQDEPPGPIAGVVDFYGPNRVTADTDIEEGLHAAVRSGAARLAERGRDAVADRFEACLRDLAPVLDVTSPTRRVSVLQVPDGAAALDGYLRTRIVELVVHGDDISESVGLPLGPLPTATDIALDVCLQMARARSGDLSVLRVFVRQERATPEDLRVL